MVTLNGDPRSSRPIFYESRRFVSKSDWESNSKAERENTQDEKRLTPRPETEGQTLPPSANFTHRSSAVLLHSCVVLFVFCLLRPRPETRPSDVQSGELGRAACLGKDGCGDTHWRPTLISSNFFYESRRFVFKENWHRLHRCVAWDGWGHRFPERKPQ